MSAKGQTWLVVDSLYVKEAWFCSHLSSYTHYLKEAGEDAKSYCLNLEGGPWDLGGRAAAVPVPASDVVFALDQFDVASAIASGIKYATMRRPKLIAQVAAITNPLPWNVRRVDGSPAYDLVISSLRWMVHEARKHGCRAEHMPLCFDHRALVCGMNVKERDIPCLFVGTTGGNHQRRTQLLAELGDVVTVAPPTFGREMFKLLARAKSVFHCGATWARGEMNAMRITESLGMRSLLIVDEPPEYNGPFFDGVECAWFKTAADVRAIVEQVDAPHMRDVIRAGHERVLTEETYVQRVPELIEIARAL